MEWLKKIYEKYLKTDQKITNFAILFIIGVIIMIAGGSLFGDSSKSKKDAELIIETNSAKNHDTFKNSYEIQLEERLENILREIEGVGKVKAMITFEGTSEIVPAVDEKSGETITEETDNHGGNRKIHQIEEENKIIMFNEAGGVQKPLIVKELQPTVKGVIIAAEGASNIQVKADILQAVKTALNIPAHKIQVFVKQK